MHNDDTGAADELMAALRDVEAGLQRLRGSVLRSEPPIADFVVLAALDPAGPGHGEATLRITLLDRLAWPIPGALANLEFPTGSAY